MTGSGNLIGVVGRTAEILFQPQDINGAGVTSDIIKLSDYDHISILIQFGTITTLADCDITVVASDADSTTHTATMATIRYRKKVADAAWSEMTSVTDSKIDVVAAGEVVPVTDENCLLCLEIDTAEVLALSSDYDMDWIKIAISSPGAVSVLVGAVAILSKGRYNTEPPLQQTA